ncbi:hypothetical protein QAD02_005063 [Eretmocerus hayati]|uniref:Uncharacterized protein n=1 Tax=Eretmocerus hayati TaxID=131215 RepID=A0ACC2NSE9_9HYME|nr:hypothetical protein QAD02_005063 [Eretmocerus hayati]
MNPHRFAVGYVPPAGAFPPGPVSPSFAFPQSPRQAYYAPAPIYSVAPSMPWPGVSAIPYAPPMVYTYSPTWGATAYQPQLVVPAPAEGVPADSQATQRPRRIRRRRPRTLSATEATETQSPANLAPPVTVSGEDRPVGVVEPMPRETVASPTLTMPQASAPSINQLLLAYGCGCCGPAPLSRPSTASASYSPTQTPAPTPAESRAPTPVNVSAPVISVGVQAPHLSVASGSSGTHPFPPLDRPTSEYDLVRVISDVLVPRVGEIPVEPVRRDPQHHADLAQLIETQDYGSSVPLLPPRPRFPFAGRDVAGNEGRPLQFPAVNSAGNPSSVRRGNNSARDTVSSTGNTASLDREPFPIVSGPLNSNPVVELPPSEPANDVLNDPRVAEALEARVEVGVHEPERAPEPDRPNEVSLQDSHLLLAEHPFIRSLPFCFTQRRRRSGSPESPNSAPQRPTILRSVLLRNTLRRNSLTTGPTRNGERAANDPSPNNLANASSSNFDIRSTNNAGPPGDIQAFSNEAPTSGLVLPASDITLDADYRVLLPIPDTAYITEEPFLNYLPIMIHLPPTDSILFPR